MTGRTGPAGRSEASVWPFGETDLPANPARVYDYWLGGKDHYRPDRELGDQVAALAPWVVHEARANRRFLERSVTFLAAEGITQFLDIGSGLPTNRNVHQIAQQVNPDARVVYVDSDPVVLTYARALLATDSRTVVVEGDARTPDRILADGAVTEHLDLSRPVAVLFVAVLHFLTDDDKPAGIVAAIRDALAPGSFVVISHASPGEDPATDAADATHEAARVYA